MRNYIKGSLALGRLRTTVMIVIPYQQGVVIYINSLPKGLSKYHFTLIGTYLISPSQKLY